MVKECAVCNSTFESNHKHRFCSDDCRYIYRKEYQKKYRKENKEVLRKYMNKFLSNNPTYQKDLRKKRNDYIASLKETIVRLSEENRRLKEELRC